jgi:hypothetical protein
LGKKGGLEKPHFSFNRRLIEHLVEDQQLLQAASIVSGKKRLFQRIAELHNL